MIDGHTRLYGLLAHPAAHSLSPAMHNLAFERCGINARYLAFDVTEATLPTAVAAIRDLHIGGVNLSMPLKQAVIPLLDELDPLAALAGSVNTIVNRDGRLCGYTTDGVGLVAALPKNIQLDRSAVVLFGAGGAAQSAALALAQAGLARLTIVNRHVEVAQDLATHLRAHVACAVDVLALADATAVNTAVAASQVVINATSMGMGPQRDLSPLTDPSCLRPDHVVLDMVYSPLETKFLKQAEAAKVQVCLNGLALLVAQGAASFKLWTQATMPVKEVEAHLATLL
ncbi:shikimate dehydrogenase [Lacticaseibacillus sp. GG6-2]